MKAEKRLWRLFVARTGFLAVVLVGVALLAVLAQNAKATWRWHGSRHYPVGAGPAGACLEGEPDGAWAGAWYWLRSPEQERRVVMSLYNRYCIRCHAVDGRGVWDIPDVPDLTNARWQSSRSDAQLTRLILEGRGAVMPAFRGTLTLEESWAMARYLRTFVPGSEPPRPDTGEPKKPDGGLPMPPKDLPPAP